jgi:hypothetical protein
MKLCAWALLSVVAGCGSEEGITQQDYCRQIAEVTCSLRYTCLNPDELELGGFPPTEAECVSDEMGECSSPPGALSCGGGEFREAMAQACIDEIDALYCDLIPMFVNRTPSCQEICP